MMVNHISEHNPTPKK